VGLTMPANNGPTLSPPADVQVVRCYRPDRGRMAQALLVLLGRRQPAGVGEERRAVADRDTEEEGDP
jgi:hypothetical protein